MTELILAILASNLEAVNVIYHTLGGLAVNLTAHSIDMSLTLLELSDPTKYLGLGESFIDPTTATAFASVWAVTEKAYNLIALGAFAFTLMWFVFSICDKLGQGPLTHLTLARSAVELLVATFLIFSGFDFVVGFFSLGSAAAKEALSPIIAQSKSVKNWEYTMYGTLSGTKELGELFVSTDDPSFIEEAKTWINPNGIYSKYIETAGGPLRHYRLNSQIAMTANRIARTPGAVISATGVFTQFGYFGKAALIFIISALLSLFIMYVNLHALAMLVSRGITLCLYIMLAPIAIAQTYGRSIIESHALRYLKKLISLGLQGYMIYGVMAICTSLMVHDASAFVTSFGPLGGGMYCVIAGLAMKGLIDKCPAVANDVVA